MIKNRTAAYCIFVVLVLAIWNVLDLLYCRFITNSSYSFGAGTDLLMPLVAGLVVGFFLIYRRNDSAE